MHPDALTFLSADLPRVDLWIEAELARLLPGEEGREPPEALRARADGLYLHNRQTLACAAPWLRFCALCGLMPIEEDLLLLALAPELDLKYAALYASLQGDPALTAPTPDLALRLCRPAGGLVLLHAALGPQGTLRRRALLASDAAGAPPAAQRSWLALPFAAAPALRGRLLGAPAFDPDLAPALRFEQPQATLDALPLPPAARATLRRAARLLAQEAPPLLVLEGHDAALRAEAAAALAGARPLLRVALNHLEGTQPAVLPERAAAALALLCRLWDAVLSLDADESATLPALLPLLQQEGLPVVLGSAPGHAWRGAQPLRALVLPLPAPDAAQRALLWRTGLAAQNLAADDDAVAAVADNFALDAGQIQAAAATLPHQRALDPAPPPLPTHADLARAARGQVDLRLDRLALRVETLHSWDDLVLPPATLDAVRTVAGAVRTRHVVYRQWGFGPRVGAGQGLKVLFAGASGTGKSMAAGVIARDAGLDLYRIDLSAVVSKYIGETEKNLEAIFRGAHGANVLLFFDEADALFGKRSEVKDAHDRYANIETSYLLQRLEQHAGAVILASNLSQNMDDAFGRRMHYVVEFPLPDAAQRERLWRGIFPAGAPLDPGVDLDFLARQFAVPGGDIQTVALDAAFLAAQDGRVITMQHLARAMARQLRKQGRVPSASEFQQHYALLGE